MRRIGLQNCPYCGSNNVYASTPKTSWERVPAVFLLQLVRCHHCMRRHFRPFLLPAAKYPAAYKLPNRRVEAVSANQTEERLGA